MNLRTHKLKVGDSVRLKLGVSDRPGRRSIAKITRFLTWTIRGVELSKPLSGCRFWNELDLEKVKTS